MHIISASLTELATPGAMIQWELCPFLHFQRSAAYGRPTRSSAKASILLHTEFYYTNLLRKIIR